MSWSLPLYEIALMSRRRADELGLRGPRITLYTPEFAPLIIFGTVPSDRRRRAAQARAESMFNGDSLRRADESEGGELFVTPGDRQLEAGAVIALPVIDRPRSRRAAPRRRGFIPIDEHARVRGLDDVYAAGDGTTFPIKQGGLGTQQADAAAEHIAAQLGAPVEPRLFTRSSAAS